MVSRYVEINGQAINYYYVGPTTTPDVTPPFVGRVPIVFIHASGQNGHSFHYQLEALGATHSPIALDLPGHGRSDGVRGCDSVGEYARWIAAFMDALALPSAVIAGRSIGGTIALEFALRYPRRTRAVIPMAAAARFNLPPELITAAEAIFKGRALPQKSIAGFAARTVTENPAVIDETWREQLKTDPRVRYYDLLACTRVDLREELDRITCPALVMTGQEDTITTPADAEFIASRIAGARLVIVPDASHNLTVEQPARINAEIERFVAQL
ncbi:MAG TPA: alpha/beta hydrolase [Candidatus Binataceae bacterium]|nr:alpha/beta hydrolase [Candidatus Binataceae bacterium]